MKDSRDNNWEFSGDICIVVGDCNAHNSRYGEGVKIRLTLISYKTTFNYSIILNVPLIFPIIANMENF
jgi:hypothetical protein